MRRAFGLLTRPDSAMDTHEVLVLNNDYEPLNICSLCRALGLIMVGKVETLHQNGHSIRTGHGLLDAPSVIRMRYHVKRPMPVLKLSRYTILARDRYRCQYCGATARDLTIDHIMPRSMGGSASWENLVACCRRCNLRKAHKTVAQAGMKLLRPPRRPRYVPYISLTKYLKAIHNDLWRDDIPEFGDFTQ